MYINRPATEEDLIEPFLTVISTYIFASTSLLIIALEWCRRINKLKNIQGDFLFYSECGSVATEGILCWRS